MMKFEDFSAGHWEKRFKYNSFEPTSINQEWVWENPSINASLERAIRALGELNAFSLFVSDLDLSVQMHVVKEAQSSSKIEGTQTGIDEALMPEEQIPPEKRDDWHEVQNYIRAVNMAVRELQNIPLSNRLLKKTHAILMEGARGEHKHPGAFRTSQNWIGGSNLNDASFIPPHKDSVLDLMSDLEKFWHNEAIQVPHIIRIALSHYQFETIHPFLDGNGRIGRLLIPLYLISKGILAKPSLYMSDFFEKNRSSYYDALMGVRTSNDLTHWILFFISGLEQTALKGTHVFKNILSLRKELESKLFDMGRRIENAQRTLNYLYKKPIIDAKELETSLKISSPTANGIINTFIKKGILEELTGQKRDRIYGFSRYIQLFHL